MKYICLIYADENGMASAPEESKSVIDAYWKFEEDIGKAGIKVAGEGLQPTQSAKTVQVTDGQTVATDGPFAETKEQLGGFYLIEVKDEAEAIRWAAKIPTAAIGGRVEVRPCMVFDQE